MNRCFISNEIVFELNLYKLAHRSYGLFSNDMQKHMNQCQCHGDTDCVRNGHIIMFMFTLLTSNEDKRFFVLKRIN